MEISSQKHFTFKEAVLLTNNELGHQAHLRKISTEPTNSSMQERGEMSSAAPSKEVQENIKRTKPKRLNPLFKVFRLFKKTDIMVVGEVETSQHSDETTNKLSVSQSENDTTVSSIDEDQHSDEKDGGLTEPEKSNVNCCSLTNPLNPWKNVLRLQDAIFFEVRVKLLARQREHFTHQQVNLISKTRYSQLLKINSVLNCLLLICLNWGKWYDEGEEMTEAVELIVKQKIYELENIIGNLQALWTHVDPKWTLGLSTDHLKDQISQYDELVYQIIQVYETLVHDLQINQPNIILPTSFAEIQGLKLKLRGKIED